MINSSTWDYNVLMITLHIKCLVLATILNTANFTRLRQNTSSNNRSWCTAFPYVQRRSSMSAGDHMVDNEQGRYCHSERERSFFKIAFSWDAHDDDQLWWGGKVLFLYTIHPCLSSRQRQRWPSWTWWPLRGWSRPTSPSSSSHQIFLKHARSSLLQGLPQILTWYDPETEPFWTLEFSTT